MTHASITLTAIALACALWSDALSQDQQKSAANARPSHQAVDRATELMRREAEAEKRARERAFARLEVAPRAAVEERAFPGGRLINRPFLEQLKGEETDEDAPDRPKFVVARESFDRFIFGSTGDAGSARAYEETVLSRLIDQVDRARPLAPAEKRKLLLAGRGGSEAALRPNRGPSANVRVPEDGPGTLRAVPCEA